MITDLSDLFQKYKTGMFSSKVVIFLSLSILFFSNGYSSDLNKVDNDINNDGADDIFYEFHAEHYYEQIDVDFDGFPDVVNLYNNDDNIVLSKIDSDFDKKWDIATFYKSNSPVLSVVDVDGDGSYEVFFSYKRGILVYSEKYIDPDSSSEDEIEKIWYSYEYPVKIEKNKVSLGRNFFQKNIIDILKGNGIFYASPDSFKEFIHLNKAAFK